MADHASAAVCELAPPSSWRYSRTFPARPDQIAAARSFLSQVLTDCQLTDDALLICSELCTNAVRHSNSARLDGQFTVRAEVRDGDCLWVEVEDQGGQWASGSGSAEGGRGLEIVAVLADYWDVRGDDTARVVCARLNWPDSQPPV